MKIHRDKIIWYSKFIVAITILILIILIGRSVYYKVYEGYSISEITDTGIADITSKDVRNASYLLDGKEIKLKDGYLRSEKDNSSAISGDAAAIGDIGHNGVKDAFVKILTSGLSTYGYLNDQKSVIFLATKGNGKIYTKPINFPLDKEDTNLGYSVSSIYIEPKTEILTVDFSTTKATGDCCKRKTNLYKYEKGNLIKLNTESENMFDVPENWLTFRSERNGFEFKYPANRPYFTFSLSSGNLRDNRELLLKQATSNDEKCDAADMLFGITKMPAIKIMCTTYWKDNSIEYDVDLKNNRILHLRYFNLQDDPNFDAAFQSSFTLFDPQKPEWLVYKNDVYGFEFKYQSDYKLTSSDGGFSIQQIIESHSEEEIPDSFGIYNIVKTPSDWKFNSTYVNSFFGNNDSLVRSFPMTIGHEYGFDVIKYNIPRGGGPTWIIEHNGFLYYFSSRSGMEFLSNFKFTK